MRLTDISLNWLLPGAVLLLGMLAAVAVLARGKRSSVKDTSADDSWERSEERRRRKEAPLRHRLLPAAVLLCGGGRRPVLPRPGRLR